jgi:hypothetical protein
MWIFDAILRAGIDFENTKNPDLIGAWRACCNGATLGRESFESIAQTHSAKPKGQFAGPKPRIPRRHSLSNQNLCGVFVPSWDITLCELWSSRCARNL